MKKYVLGLFLASIIVVLGIAVVVKNGNNESSKNTTPANNTTNTTSSSNNTDRSFTNAEVAAHNKPTDCWIVVANNVYDVSKFVNKHPGGADQITPLCGKDATSAFEGQHGNPNSNSRQAMELNNLKIGTIK